MRRQYRLWIRLWLMLLVSGTSLCPLPSLAQTGLIIEAIVLHNANLRVGPGVAYEIIGTAKAGQFVIVTDDEGEWYQLSTGEWIAKFLVAATPESRVVAFRLEDAPAVANRTANLRSGPGTTYTLVGRIYAGQALKVVGQNQAGDWLQLQSGQWLAAFLVDRVATGLPVIAVETAPSTTPLPESPPAIPMPPATPARMERNK